MFSRRLTAITIVALLWPAAPVSAQTSLQIPLQFDFLNPGARSLAIGGAFVALADDATAGFANPAGLMELNRMQVSVELRARRLESLFLERGRLSGAISNQLTDTIAGPVFGQSRDQSGGLGFISIVMPSSSRKWTVAAFRHELVRVDQAFLSQGVFQQDPVEFTSRRDTPQEGIRRISLTNYGLAGARQLSSRLSVGATLSVYHFALDSEFTRFDFEGFLGPPILTTVLGRSTQKGSGVSVAPALGVQFCVKACDDRSGRSARFGAAYRRGPSFKYDTRDGQDPVRTQTFRSPSTLAVGAAVEMAKPGRRLLFATEVTYITYSRLERDYVVDQALGSGLQDQFFVDNGVEYHFGAQYTWERPWVPKFRVGIWSDPNHTVRFRSNAALAFPTDRLKEELMRTALSTGERLTHLTAGVGLSISSRLAWNLGADFAPRSTVISSSIIVNVK